MEQLWLGGYDWLPWPDIDDVPAIWYDNPEKYFGDVYGTQPTLDLKGPDPNYHPQTKGSKDSTILKYGFAQNCSVAVISQLRRWGEVFKNGCTKNLTKYLEYFWAEKKDPMDLQTPGLILCSYTAMQRNEIEIAIANGFEVLKIFPTCHASKTKKDKLGNVLDYGRAVVLLGIANPRLEQSKAYQASKLDVESLIEQAKQLKLEPYIETTNSKSSGLSNSNDGTSVHAEGKVS